jgi:hypothetical protein
MQLPIAGQSFLGRRLGFFSLHDTTPSLANEAAKNIDLTVEKGTVQDQGGSPPLKRGKRLRG